MAIQRIGNGMVLRVFFLGILLTLVSCSDKPEVVEKGIDYAPAEPKFLYLRNCESCHGLDGKKGVSGAADLSVSTLSDEEVLSVILNGNQKGMMPYKDIITVEAERNSLVDFVKSLRK
jgi:mono/diheme cytochrome c family protein